MIQWQHYYLVTRITLEDPFRRPIHYFPLDCQIRSIFSVGTLLEFDFLFASFHILGLFIGSFRYFIDDILHYKFYFQKFILSILCSTCVIFINILYTSILISLKSCLRASKIVLFDVSNKFFCNKAKFFIHFIIKSRCYSTLEPNIKGSSFSCTKEEF